MKGDKVEMGFTMNEENKKMIKMNEEVRLPQRPKRRKCSLHIRRVLWTTSMKRADGSSDAL